jgi:signal transduction histidine kinase
MRTLAAATLLLVAAGALAEERATTRDAEALVHRAVALVQKDGRDKALAVFNDPKGPFTYRDLYVVAYALDGTCLAHAVKPDRVGKNLINDKDASGKLFIKERMELAKRDGKGWQEYLFLNPSTKKVESKVAYFEVVDGLVLMCGAYKP